jgi:hypothetical protein
MYRGHVPVACSMAGGGCYPFRMRVLLGVVLALLFAVHTAYAAAPRPLDCCEGLCGDAPCAMASCACEPLTLPAMPRSHGFVALEPARPATALVMPDKRSEDIWRPPWPLG